MLIVVETLHDHIVDLDVDVRDITRIMRIRDEMRFDTHQAEYVIKDIEGNNGYGVRYGDVVHVFYDFEGLDSIIDNCLG